jgi:signal transduction histidine kinase
MTSGSGPVAIIDQEARRLAHLVENILQFSRAERSSTRVSLEPLELAALVDEVVDGFAPLAGARGVTVRTTHSGHGRGARGPGRAAAGPAQPPGQCSEVWPCGPDDHGGNAGPR